MGERKKWTVKDIDALTARMRRQLERTERYVPRDDESANELEKRLAAKNLKAEQGKAKAKSKGSKRVRFSYVAEAREIPGAGRHQEKLGERQTRPLKKGDFPVPASARLAPKPEQPVKPIPDEIPVIPTGLNYSAMKKFAKDWSVVLQGTNCRNARVLRNAIKKAFKNGDFTAPAPVNTDPEQREPVKPVRSTKPKPKRDEWTTEDMDAKLEQLRKEQGFGQGPKAQPKKKNLSIQERMRNVAKLTLEAIAKAIDNCQHTGRPWYRGQLDPRLRPFTQDHIKNCIGLAESGTLKPQVVSAALVARIQNGTSLEDLDAEARFCEECQARRKKQKARDVDKHIDGQFEAIDIVSNKQHSKISAHMAKNKLMIKLGLTKQDMKDRGIGKENKKVNAGWVKPEVTAADADKSGDGGLGDRIRKGKEHLKPTGRLPWE